MLDKREHNVHAHERGHERGHHKDDGNGCQAFDGEVEVVGNDGAVGIHRAVQDVGVHIGHLLGLMVINDDILEDFQLLLILADVQEINPLHFHFQQLVVAKGGHKIDQAFFDAKQVLQFLVPATVVKFFLDQVALLVELF